ncbi:MAG: hypothetical protein QOK29_1002 [Rhodospirillaceae bacterium]|jgi:uncharacterized protein involved in exopolysaccharide biosynthesis|nr:hypothetical protein [Rhodospirillaceae bacterium]
MIVQVTPRGLLNTFFRHRGKFLLVFLLFFGTAAAYCLVATPKYKSEARLLVKFAQNQTSRNSSLPSSTIFAQQLERKEVVNSQISMMQSKDLLKDVLKSMKIDQVYPSLAASTKPGLLEDAAMSRFDKDLEVLPEKDAEVIDLSLLNPDPVVAAKTLQQLIDKFISMQSTIYQSQQLPFLQQQLAQARQVLEKSRAAVRSYKIASGISSLDEERTLLLRQQSNAREALTQEISHQQEAEGRYARLEAELKAIPVQVKLSDENDRFKVVDDARGRLAELQAREKELSANYRSDSTTMKELHSQILFAQQQLATMSRESAARVRTGANPVRQQVEIALAQAAGDQYSATAGRVSYETELTRISKRLSDIETQGVRLDELELQQQVDEENFRNMLQQVEDARVADDLNRQRITSIAMVQAPTAPVKPAKPRVPLILAGGLLLGLAGGIAIMLISEMATESFATPDQLEAVAGLAVLGSFTKARLPAPVLALARPRSRTFTVLLQWLLVLALAGAPSIAWGADLLDPGYGRRLGVTDNDNKLTEILVPDGDKFFRRSKQGETIGEARRIGATLRFYNRDGRMTAIARPELLPPDFPLAAIAIVRDTIGRPIGAITRN